MALLKTWSYAPTNAINGDCPTQSVGECKLIRCASCLPFCAELTSQHFGKQPPERGACGSIINACSGTHPITSGGISSNVACVLGANAAPVNSWETWQLSPFVLLCLFSPCCRLAHGPIAANQLRGDLPSGRHPENDQRELIGPLSQLVAQRPSSPVQQHGWNESEQLPSSVLLLFGSVPQ